MIRNLIVTVAALGFATAATAHPLPAAKTRPAAHTAALDTIIGEVQLDSLIARVVPADSGKRATPGHRTVYASATPTKARDRS